MVVTGAFDIYSFAIKQETVLWSKFYGTNTKRCIICVHYLTVDNNFIDSNIPVGRLYVPVFGMIYVAIDCGSCVLSGFYACSYIVKRGGLFPNPIKTVKFVYVSYNLCLYIFSCMIFQFYFDID